MERLHPECSNCDFFIQNSQTDRKCRKHDFVMPKVDWSVLCKDWQHQRKSVDFLKMPDNELYYYTYAQGLQSAFLGKFANLQNMIMSVSIRHDSDLGWVVFPRRYQNYFPPPDDLLTIMLNHRQSRFRVTNTERNLAVEMFPNEAGEWEAHYHTQQVFMMYSLESPNILRDWLEAYIDFDRYLQESAIPSFHAFAEVVEQETEYILHPDLLAYGDYRRKKK